MPGIRRRKRQLGEQTQAQDDQRRKRRPVEQFLPALVAVDGERGLLQLVDLVVDAVQRIRVRRPVEPRAGCGRDPAQGVLIHIHLFHDDALATEGIRHRKRRLAAHADADGVDLDAQRLGRLGSRDAG